MKNYIGIDLGTTNSAICSYNGKEVRVWKSPEQNDVTPSAIFVDRRGNKYYGRRAYEMAPTNEKNAAVLFKRYMGTSTTFNFAATKESLTPEQCSAEILKVLYGYLPEEIRNDPETATVITVPAAFNQVKKDATLEAAKLAGIQNIALMQEPVAAIMSVMRASKEQGMFLVYDLGGGTFDVSVAVNIDGKVNLQTQGGKEMCGGRDWDKMIFNQIIVPWLQDNFDLPEDFLVNPGYKLLHRLSLFAAEQAKIELSSCEETSIRMDEARLNKTDESGEEIYLDIPITRDDLNKLIDDQIQETIEVTRDVMTKGGLTASDIERIVFVGGPTNYKPLRDKVAAELALPANTDVNPMTAVAEGASIFAESIDWDTENHNRKAARAEMEASANVSLRYERRTSGSSARVAFIVEGNDSMTAEIVSEDTGWSSGRAPLKQGTVMKLPLRQEGENHFHVTVYNRFGNAIRLEEDHIVITKTLATIGAIPASYSVAIEVLEKLGGTPVPVYLIQENDPLPKKGSVVLKAGQTLKAGSNDAFVFKLWEGSIPYPITDNRFIGTYKIPGTSFANGVVPMGAEIVCEYEMSDSGAIHLGVSIPSIGADFGNINFYSRQEGQLDLDDVDSIAEDGRNVLNRIDNISKKVNDESLIRAREKAQQAAEIENETHDKEDIQAAYNELLSSKKLVAQVRRDHLKEIRKLDLEEEYGFYAHALKKYATAEEDEAYQNLYKAAQRAIEHGSNDFDNLLAEMKRRDFSLLWRQDSFVIECFKYRASHPALFADKNQFERLKQKGMECMRTDKIDELRQIVSAMDCIRNRNVSSEEMFAAVNVIKG